MNRLLFLLFIFLMGWNVYSYSQIRINQDNRESYIQTARQLFKEKKWKEAKKNIDKGLSEYPEDADLRELNGRYYLQTYDYDKARFELNKALEYNRNSISAKQGLINIEMATGRYSSAISYVNELLEVLPYDKDLWLKKAEGYRVQGNIEESNRLLKRICQIYPNDKSLKKNLIESLSEELHRKKNNTPINDVAELALYIIKEDPLNEDAFIGLINSHIQIGDYPNALLYAERAAINLPLNIAVIKKKISILAHLNRYREILSYLSGLIRKEKNNLLLQKEYNYYLKEAAFSSQKSDSYHLFQTLFLKNPENIEYFNKVYSIALSKNLFDDAIEAIKLIKKKKGEAKEILLKELALYERINNPAKTKQIIYRINELYPEDTDVRYKKCGLYYKEAKDLMAEGFYQKAIPILEVVEKDGDEEFLRLTLISKYNCYERLGNIQKAESELNRLIDLEPTEVYWRLKKSNLAAINNDYLIALKEYEIAMRLAKERDDELKWLIDGYNEQAVAYTKTLIASYHFKETIELIDHWLTICPDSQDATRYGYNVASQMKNSNKMKNYLLQGAQHYPQEIFFQLKLAEIHISEKNFDAASALLLPLLERFPYHKDLIAAHSQLCIDKGKLLTKELKAEEGLAMLDNALLYDPDNIDLKYIKGIVYEKLHMPDSAAYYQSFYQPLANELGDYERHMKYLEHMKKKNLVSFSCLLYRFADIGTITSVAETEYSRIEKNDTYTGRFFYSGREDKRGFMFQGEWTHKVTANWYGMINASVGDVAFPKFMTNIASYYTFRPDWEVELSTGFRNLADSKNMFNLQTGLSKELDFARFTGKLNSVILDKKWYYNISAQSRFYIADHKNYIAAIAGFGSAPDIDIINNQIYNTFNVTNVMAALGGHFILNKTCALEAMGTCYNYKAANDRYRNMYSLQLKLNIRF